MSLSENHLQNCRPNEVKKINIVYGTVKVPQYNHPPTIQLQLTTIKKRKIIK